MERWHFSGAAFCMIRNYLKTAWRSIAANKVYSALNIAGLATGMAVALLIGLWAYNEYTYDRFLPGHEQLYQVKQNGHNNGAISTYSSVSLALANALRADVPEIKYLAETDWVAPHILTAGEHKLLLPGLQTGEHFLEMFRFPLLQGNAGTVLKDPYSIVLTEATAHALFGNKNAVGQMVRVDNSHDLMVTGILKDVPANSSFQFSYLIPFSFFEQTQSWVKTDRTAGFDENSFQEFIQLQPGVTYEQASAKIKDIIKKHNPDNNTEVIIQPMQRWHLYSSYENGREAGGFIDYVRMFCIIGALVLLIACINFVNLSTARSEKRAREIGVRKAIGSRRQDIILQFLTESFVIALIAGLCSILLVQLSLPLFNTMTGGQLHIPYGSGIFWCMMAGYIFITGLLAGSRPAFYLSAFRPVKAIKGAIKGGRSATVSRKVLVVTQFSCSVALIISMAVIYKQIRHAMARDTGYNMNRLLVTNMNGDLTRNYTVLKNEMLKSGAVTNVTKASCGATYINWFSGVDSWPGKEANEGLSIGTIAISGDYFKTMGIEMLRGRDFSAAPGADSLSVVLNEAAVKRFRMKEPLGQVISWHHGIQLRVIGVVKNTLMTSPFVSPEPVMFIHSHHYISDPVMIYRLSFHTGTKEAIDKITAVFNRYSPASPYTYQFADKNYAAKFNLEMLTGRLVGIFAGLAVFISCLGLFGLAAYMAEQRTKEIGIRKVLGASVLQLWMLLSKDYLLLVLISCVIAAPVAWYFLRNWLLQYPYRISISGGIFVATAMAAIFITAVTVSFQTIKTSMINPVRTLRSE